MRETNWSFPPQNRACVCITGQLYDRRALDTTSPLPLFNSLNHLTYLTATSPRIREIVAADGGLERLVRILRDFCISPPQPESPTHFYGLLPPIPSTKSKHVSPAPSMIAPYDPKRPFDRAAAYRFSLAFQSVVNIGVRGTEPIRARVVQAGTLDVVGCLLETWLASKGFAVLPSASASGIPRETREQRHARRLAAMEPRQRDSQSVQTREITSPLQRRPIQARDIARALQREATGRRTEEDEDMLDNSTVAARPIITRANPSASDTSTSNDTSPTSTPRGSTTPTTSTREHSDTITQQHHHHHHHHHHHTATTPSRPPNLRTDTEPESDADAEMEDATRSMPTQQPVGIVDDTTPAVGMGVGLNRDMLLGGGMGVRVGEERLPEDDLAMGAPPGAPGNLNLTINMALDDALGMMGGRRDAQMQMEDMTPRARIASLPDPLPPQPQPQPQRPPPAPAQQETGPFRQEDVVLALQLLAYLSKYPHIRQAFYERRGAGGFVGQLGVPGQTPSVSSGRFFRTLASRGKEKEKDLPGDKAASQPSSQSTNVFSLVERFTFRPSPNETQLPSPPPFLHPEIQYWAGIVMRNACRKDESRGGLRQCANMMCGKWETKPREFAKCRRCRKAKYCGKECQSRAWAEGHRFWCTAKEEDGVAEGGGNTEEATGGAERVRMITGVGTGVPFEEQVRQIQMQAGPSRPVVHASLISGVGTGAGGGTLFQPGTAPAMGTGGGFHTTTGFQSATPPLLGAPTAATGFQGAQSTTFQAAPPVTVAFHSAHATTPATFLAGQQGQGHGAYMRHRVNAMPGGGVQIHPGLQMRGQRIHTSRTQGLPPTSPISPTHAHNHTPPQAHVHMPPHTHAHTSPAHHALSHTSPTRVQSPHPHPYLHTQRPGPSMSTTDLPGRRGSGISDEEEDVIME